MYFHSVRNRINSGTTNITVNWLILSYHIRFQQIVDILSVADYDASIDLFDDEQLLFHGGIGILQL